MKNEGISKTRTVYPPKITRPRVAKALPRPRLFTAIDQARQCASIVWISAPGGSGKTTLLSSYLESRGVKYIWYQIDEGDADEATFFHYLGLAGKRVAPRRKKKLPAFSPGHLPHMNIYIRRFFEGLSLCLGGSGVIVLDNANLLGSKSWLNQFLSIIAESVGSKVSIILISRQQAPTEANKLRAKNNFCEITFEDIRFTRDEWKELPELLDSRIQDSSTLDNLYNKMDGWVSGYILMSNQINEEKKAFDVLMNREDVFAYFAHDFFHDLSDHEQKLLLMCSFLNNFSAHAANEIANIGNAESILRNLVNNNNFVQKKGIFYTIHPLFQSFLQHEVKNMFCDSDLNQMRQASAKILIDHKEYTIAAQLLINIGDWDALTTLLLNNAKSLYVSGRVSILHEWIGKLPKSILTVEPWLLYWDGMCWSFTNVEKALELLNHSSGQFIDQNDVHGIWSAWHSSLQIINATWVGANQLPRLLDDYDHLQGEYGSPTEIIPNEKLTVNMAIGHLLSCHNHKNIDFWLSKLEQSIDTCNDEALRAELISGVLFACFGSGLTDRGAYYLHMLKQIEETVNLDPISMLNIKVNLMLAECHVGDPLEGLGRYNQTKEYADKHGFHVFDGIMLVSCVMMAVAIKDHSLMDMHIKSLEALSGHSLIDNQNYKWGKTQIALCRGRYQEALSSAQESYDLVRQANIPIYQLITALSLVEAYWYSGAKDKAKQLLSKVGAGSVIECAPSQFLKYHFLNALFAYDENRMDDAYKSITQGLALAKTHGMHRFSGWSDELVSWVCKTAIELNVEVGFIKQYIQSQQGWLQAPEPSVISWPWLIRIYTFGAFQVLRNDMPLGTRAHSSKPLAIIKQLVGSHKNGMDLGVLRGRLYPDAQPTKATKLFDDHLYRLRRILDNDRTIIIDGGRVYLNKNICWIDNEAFDLMEKRFKGNGMDVTLGKKALDIYTGQYLPDDESYDTVALRQNFHARYLACLMNCVSHADLDPSEAIELCMAGLLIDPLCEPIYRYMIRVYLRQGRRDLAEITFSQCKRVLKDMLDVEPTDETRALIH